jgi:ketosteroid isomerase-like protein
MSEEEKRVIAANESFYRAFESLDIKEMEKIWLREPYIQCVHPGWSMLRGWEPVMESWRRIFENTSDIRFLLSDVAVRVQGAIAVVTLYENISSAADPRGVSTVVATTNLFEKRAEQWRMIHHHGSPVAAPPPRTTPSTVH